jgi:hypothetical protein
MEMRSAKKEVEHPQPPRLAQGGAVFGVLQMPKEATQKWPVSKARPWTIKCLKMPYPSRTTHTNRTID